MTERVMIVEDNPILSIDMCDMISNLGFETSGIANSFASAQALAPHSDIALVNVNRRDGATGPRIGQYLAGEFGIAVVMVAATPEAIEANLSSVIGLISKPVNPATIEAVLTFVRGIRQGKREVPPSGMRIFA